VPRRGYRFVAPVELPTFARAPDSNEVIELLLLSSQPQLCTSDGGGSREPLHLCDWDGSEEEFNRTMALNPNHVWAREWHARGLVTRGRTEEAIAQAKLSASLDPSPWSGDYPVWILFLARRYDLALEHARDLVELAPNYSWGHFALALVYEQMGKADEGARESLKADELFGTDPITIARLKNALEKSGARGYWGKKLDYYLESAKAGYAPPVLTAEACMRVDDKQCTFEWLEKGFLERDDLMINLAVNPVFDGIRTDPHYQDLVRRVGIPSSAAPNAR